MKVFFTVFLALLVAIGVYTLCSYTQTFQVQIVTHIAFALCYFILGILIRKYYDIKIVKISFVLTTVLLVASVIWRTILGGGLLNAAANSMLLFGSLSFGYYFKLLSIKMSSIVAISIVGLIIGWSILFPIIRFNQMLAYQPYMPDKIISDIIQTSVTDENRNEIKLPVQKGKVYLLEFYKRYCVPCIEKQHVLNQLNEKIDNPNFVIIYMQAGNLDSFETFLEVCKKEGGLNRYYDVNGDIGKLFKIAGHPTEYLIDKNGKVRYSFVGYGKSIEDNYFKTTLSRVNELLYEQ